MIPSLIPFIEGGPMNREVNLTKRVQTVKGMRHCPIVLSPNGRVKPDLVMIDGKPERHPEGSYYLEWCNGSKRMRLSVGKNAADTDAKRQRKEAELNALNKGVAVVPETGQNGHRPLAGAVADYLDEIKLTKKPKDPHLVFGLPFVLHGVLPETKPGGY